MSIGNILEPIGLLRLLPVFEEEDLTSVSLLQSMGGQLNNNLLEIGLSPQEAELVAGLVLDQPSALPKARQRVQPTQPPEPPPPPAPPPAVAPPAPLAPPPAQSPQQPITMRQISALLQEQRTQIEDLQRRVPSLEVTLQRALALGASISTVLDIGACRGDWTRSARHVLPDARFTLVEPLHYEELGADDLRDCAVHRALLYRDETDVDFYSLRNTGDSIYKETTQAYAGVAAQRRRATTLVALFGADASFDLIKIDVQGAEVDVMMGGEAIVRRAGFVLLEVPFMGQYNAGARGFLEVLQYMQSLGFVPLDVLELHREAHVLLQMDVMFVRSDHLVAANAQRAIESYRVVS